MPTTRIPVELRNSGLVFTGQSGKTRNVLSVRKKNAKRRPLFGLTYSAIHVPAHARCPAKRRRRKLPRPRAHVAGKRQCGQRGLPAFEAARCRPGVTPLAKFAPCARAASARRDRAGPCQLLYACLSRPEPAMLRNSKWQFQVKDFYRSLGVELVSEVACAPCDYVRARFIRRRDHDLAKEGAGPLAASGGESKNKNGKKGPRPVKARKVDLSSSLRACERRQPPFAILHEKFRVL